MTLCLCKYRFLPYCLLPAAPLLNPLLTHQLGQLMRAPTTKMQLRETPLECGADPRKQ